MTIDKNAVQMSYEASHHMHYKPIAKNNIQRIRIWLAEDHMGVPLKSRGNTMVRLEFVPL